MCIEVIVCNISVVFLRHSVLMITGTSFLELWYPFCYLASNSIHSISDCALVVMLTHVMLTIYLFAYTVAVVATYRCCICSKQWFSYRQRRLIGSDSG